MRDMKITTESGSTYTIIHGICKKYDARDNFVDVFKVYGLAPFNAPIRITDLYELPKGEPTVGMSIFIWGKDIEWASTPVVGIEYLESESKSVLRRQAIENGEEL